MIEAGRGECHWSRNGAAARLPLAPRKRAECRSPQSPGVRAPRLTARPDECSFQASKPKRPRGRPGPLLVVSDITPAPDECSEFSLLRRRRSLLRRRKDSVARDEPVAHLDHPSNVHRVEKLIRCDLAARHQERRDKAVSCTRLKRGQRHRLLSAVSLRMLGGKLACALLAFKNAAAGKLDHCIIGRQARGCVPIRR
jgi:hypothetical protein